MKDKIIEYLEKKAFKPTEVAYANQFSTPEKPKQPDLSYLRQTPNVPSSGSQYDPTKVKKPSVPDPQASITLEDKRKIKEGSRERFTPGSALDPIKVQSEREARRTGRQAQTSETRTKREEARKQSRVKDPAAVKSPEKVQQVKETLKTQQASAAPARPIHTQSPPGGSRQVIVPPGQQVQGLPLANKLMLGGLGAGGLAGAYHLMGGEMPEWGDSVPNIPPSADLVSRMAPNVEMPSVDPSMLEEYAPWALGGAAALGGGALLKHKLAQRLAAQRAAQANARLGSALKWGGLGLGGLAGLNYLMSGRNQDEEQ